MNTVCTHCQAINRIPDDRIEDAAKCGRCGHDLFDGEVINATGETLDKLLKDDLPVVIDFWAPWCGPCRNFAPIFEDVAQERSGKVRFVKVNTEAERELSSRFGIRSIPTIMIFKNGQVVDMLNGAVPKAPFDSWLNESLVIIIGLFDLFSSVQQATVDPAWLGMSTEGYVFAALIYWIFCFSMSRYSQYLEKRFNTGRTPH